MNQTSDKSEYVIFSATELAEKMDDIEIQTVETYGGDTVETPFYEGKQVYLKLTGIVHRGKSGAEIRLGTEIDEQIQALLNIDQHMKKLMTSRIVHCKTSYVSLVSPPNVYKGVCYNKFYTASIMCGDDCVVFEKDSDKADQSTSPVHESMIRSIVVCRLTFWQSTYESPTESECGFGTSLRARQIQHLDSIPVKREFNDKLAL